MARRVCVFYPTWTVDESHARPKSQRRIANGRKTLTYEIELHYTITLAGLMWVVV